jgi:rfaE bifunctional protein nucleotidyltransferase chain/domain
MFKKILELLKAPGPWRKAMVLAAASDAISFGLASLVVGSAGLMEPVQVVVDLITAIALWAILGFRWPLLAGLTVEAIPGLSAFPTWTLAVGAMMAAESATGAVALATTPGPAASPAPRPATSKILSREALAAEVARLRAAGKKVVFTNGVFDLLHVGHLRYLKQARGLGDCLVIGLNADECVRRLKGDKRPILPEAERAELLAGLDCVDYVCLFPEDDPRELIKAATPSILVKGGDWPIDKILGRDTVEAAGGTVLSLPFVEGRSTTSIVESIVSRYAGGFKE